MGSSDAKPGSEGRRPVELREGLPTPEGELASWLTFFAIVQAHHRESPQQHAMAATKLDPMAGDLPVIGTAALALVHPSVKATDS
jgi:hypothetical protein